MKWFWFTSLFLIRKAASLPRLVNNSSLFFFKACFCLHKRSGLWQAVSSCSEKNGSDSSLTAVSGIRNSIWHQHALGVVSLAAYTFREEKKNSQISRRRSDSLFISVIQAPALRSAPSQWQQQHHSRSILHHNISIRRQTMWEPMCPRMQMLLLHTRGDGLCNGEQHAESAGMRQTSHHKPMLLFYTRAWKKQRLHYIDHAT